MSLFFSIYIIIGTFTISTISAILICYLNNYSFINPNLTDEEQIIQLNDYIRHIPLLLVKSTGFMYIISNNIIPYGQHTWIESSVSITSYCLLIEAIYYTYHRFIHKYYYVTIHKKHHVNIIVYPMDTFYLTDVDEIATIISIGLPIIFIKVSAIEHALILYIYITSSYLSHSNIYWDHHNIHHKLIRYNYCILIPIFDIIFGTYKY
jgi:sterol desaturase/sphingolipid hydroxylase (fatty acid hydroxylase superfamily)